MRKLMNDSRTSDAPSADITAQYVENMRRRHVELWTWISENPSRPNGRGRRRTSAAGLAQVNYETRQVTLA